MTDGALVDSLMTVQRRLRRAFSESATLAESLRQLVLALRPYFPDEVYVVWKSGVTISCDLPAYLMETQKVAWAVPGSSLYSWSREDVRDVDAAALLCYGGAAMFSTSSPWPDRPPAVPVLMLWRRSGGDFEMRPHRPGLQVMLDRIGATEELRDVLLRGPDFSFKQDSNPLALWNTFCGSFAIPLQSVLWPE